MSVQPSHSPTNVPLAVIPSSPLSPETFAHPHDPALASAHLPPAVADMPQSQALPQSAAITAIDPLVSAHLLLNSQRKMRILVLSSDTGGGHRASADALRSALQALHPTLVQIDVVDFWVDLAEGPFSKFPEQYTFLAKHPWMWKLTYELTRFPPGRAITESFFNTFAHRKIRHAFEKYAPDLIISVHPLVNTLSQNVLRKMQQNSGVPAPPYITVVTDLGGAHPTWFNKKCDMIYVPSDAIFKTALRVGVPNEKVCQMGLPVRPDFWQAAPEKRDIRIKLGIDPDLPAILAIGGGDGVGGLKTIVTKLARDLPKRLHHSQVQLVAICGKNEQLREWLSTQSWPISVIALGYVSNMSDWMTASDILCTKAGPGTIAESLIRGLPIVITGFLPGQEEANVRFVVNERVGAFAKKPDRIVSLVASWLSQPDALSGMSARAQQLGRPHASLDIARDIISVAKKRIEENVRVLENNRRVRQAHMEFTRSGLSQFLPHRQFLLESGSQSFLWIRLRFFMRIIFGTLIVRDAFQYRSDDSEALRGSDSPFEVIEDCSGGDDDNDERVAILP